MRKLAIICVGLIAVAMVAQLVVAQDADKPEGPRKGKRPGGPGAEGKRRPHFVPPLMAALDADKDGALSADEIANAATALLTLDKNADGKLDRMELRPPRRGGKTGEDAKGDRPGKGGKGGKGHGGGDRPKRPPRPEAPVE